MQPSFDDDSSFVRQDVWILEPGSMDMPKSPSSDPEDSGSLESAAARYTIFDVRAVHDLHGVFVRYMPALYAQSLVGSSREHQHRCKHDTTTR